MSKEEFLAELRIGLSGLPQSDIEERMTFYEEMIDDRMEEGLTEEEAVSQIGSVQEVISQILTETPITKLVMEKVRPKRNLQVWEIVLLILGSPIWLSLLIATLAIIFSLYVTLLSVIISLWAVEVALAGCSFGGVFVVARLAYQGTGIQWIAMLGVSIFCAGLTIFLFFGCKEITKGISKLTIKIALGIKSFFVGRRKYHE